MVLLSTLYCFKGSSKITDLLNFHGDGCFDLAYISYITRDLLVFWILVIAKTIGTQYMQMSPVEFQLGHIFMFSH